MNKKRHISFLLGAGFSAPMGYPLGGDLNNKIVDFDIFENDFLRGDIFNYVTKHYNIAYQLCRCLIHRYVHYVEFDYERFFDFLKYDLLKAPFCKK